MLVGCESKQSLDASGGLASQRVTTAAGTQSMNLQNSSASQSQVGLANSQTIDAVDSTNIGQSQQGVGNTQSISAGPGARNIKQSQTGFSNDQKMIIGNAKK